MFEPISLTWENETREVPADQVLKLIATIENQVSYFDLVGKPLFAKVASAYADALKFAGFRNVTAEQVYVAIFGGKSDAVGAVNSLLSIMIPPSILREKPDEKKYPSSQA